VAQGGRRYGCGFRRSRRGSRHSVNPVTLPGKGVRRQWYPLDVSVKQSLKVQRISLNIKLGDGCQILQVVVRVRRIPALLNAVVSKLFKRNLLPYSGLLNLCRINLARRPRFDPLLEKMDQLVLIARQTGQAMGEMHTAHE
jgi:hypothetical protein